MQSTAYARMHRGPGGTGGTGPDVAVVLLYYVVSGAVDSDQVEFVLTQTHGDPTPTGGLVASGATLYVVPEPGSALLIGLGLSSLAASGRRRGRVRVG